VSFVPFKVGGGDWQVIVQNETRAQRVHVEIMDMMIGTNIDGVFMDMQMVGVIRDNGKDIEKGRRCW